MSKLPPVRSTPIASDKVHLTFKIRGAASPYHRVFKASEGDRVRQIIRNAKADDSFTYLAINIRDEHDRIVQKKVYIDKR